jgi:hypothetical protein
VEKGLVILPISAVIGERYYEFITWPMTSEFRKSYWLLLLLSLKIIERELWRR